ncbi:MAG: protein kinase [Polyangiaceae bacterium]
MPSGRGQIAGTSARAPRALRSLAPGDEIADEETGERYRVHAQIGQGGMGRVFRGEAIATGQIVAIKCNHELDATNEALIERTRREGGFLKKLQRHPHIVPVLATGMRGDGVSWMVMPLLEGASVGSLIATLGRIPLVWTLRIVQAVCSALAEAHRYALHRDIKPENVFVTRQGQIYVLDFGAGKFYAVRRLTTTGTTVGTIAYSSPEQLTDPDSLDGRSDLFSVGVMAFEMLTGEHPFDTDGPLRGNAIVIGNRIIREPPRPLALLAPGLPDYVPEIINKLLEKDRRDRSRNAAEAEQVFGAAYRAVCSRLPEEPPIERIFDLYDEAVREQEREILATQDTEKTAAELRSAERPRFGTVPIAEFSAAPAQVTAPALADVPAPAQMTAAAPAPAQETAPAPPEEAAAPPRLRNKTIRMGPPVFGMPPLAPSEVADAIRFADGRVVETPAIAAADARAPQGAAPAETDEGPPSSERSRQELDEYINRKLVALDRLLTDPSPETRDVLIRVMREPEEEPVIRAGAGLVLLTVGDEASLDAMQACAETDPNPVVRRKLEEYSVALALRLGVAVEPLPFLGHEGRAPLSSWVPPAPDTFVPSVTPSSDAPSSVTPTLLSQPSAVAPRPAPSPPVVAEPPPAPTTTQRSPIVAPETLARGTPPKLSVSVQPPAASPAPLARTGPPAAPVPPTGALVPGPRVWSTGALAVLAIVSALVAAAIVLVLLFFVFK